MSTDAVNRAAGSAGCRGGSRARRGGTDKPAVLTIEGARMAVAEIRGGCYDCPDGRDD